MKQRMVLTALIMALFFVLNSHAQQGDFQVFKGPYLGQKPPGTTPEVFAPGIVSTSDHEFSCCFSPDGNEFYFTRRCGDPETAKIMMTRKTKDGWTVPEVAPFSGRHYDFEPHVSPDGSKMFFNRHDPSDTTIYDGIWVMRRIADGWGEPTYMGPGMYATATLDGSIYLTDRSRPVEKQGIVKTRLIDNRFAEFEWQEGGVNSPRADRKAGRHPYIAPDESFIIFDSYKKGTGDTGRLFVCFRKKDGSWSKAIDLGEEINFAPIICASLSPDGEYLFFGSNGGIPGHKGDIYWVSAKIIDELREKALDAEEDK